MTLENVPDLLVLPQGGGKDGVGEFPELDGAPGDGFIVVPQFCMKGGEGCRTQSGEAAVSGDAALEGCPPVEAAKSGKNFLGRGGAPDQGEGFYGIVEGGKTPVNPAEGHLELMDQVLGFLLGGLFLFCGDKIVPAGLDFFQAVETPGLPGTEKSRGKDEAAFRAHALALQHVPGDVFERGRKPRLPDAGNGIEPASQLVLYPGVEGFLVLGRVLFKAFVVGVAVQGLLPGLAGILEGQVGNGLETVSPGFPQFLFHRPQVAFSGQGLRDGQLSVPGILGELAAVALDSPFHGLTEVILPVGREGVGIFPREHFADFRIEDIVSGVEAEGEGRL